VAEPQTLIGGRYRLVRRVGSGGMGTVWEASDERLERQVALKQLHRPLEASPAEAEVANRRAMREARTAAKLHHPHAVSVFDVVEQDGQLWLVMPFIASITLAAVLHEGGPLQPNEAAKVGAQVASALTAAHAAGIVHRDVKPGNILIAEDGTALISDFGIAYGLGDATLTSSGMIHGTPAYLAPEIARGDGANFASDVFSLGSTLYSAMEGTPPFGSDDNTMALLHRVASGQFPVPQHCGPLTPLVMDMLSADPSHRPSMRAVADSLAGVRPPTASPPSAEVPDSSTDEASTTSVPDSLPAPAPASSVHRPTEPRRHRGLAAALAILLLGGGILLAALLVNDRKPVNPTAGTGESTSAPPTNPRLATPTPDTSSKTPSSSSTQAQAPSATAAPPTKSPKPSRTPSATTAPTVRGAATAAQLRQAITSYYALLPRNTEAAWPGMTDSYQRNHAGGRQAYQRFWDAISTITVTKVKGSPPGSAQATITYHFKDGRVIRERTAYGLIDDNGRLKINSSTVLSSTPLRSGS
jgi:eukaryotic-like serine/threonine-protein kinase